MLARASSIGFTEYSPAIVRSVSPRRTRWRTVRFTVGSSMSAERFFWMSSLLPSGTRTVVMPFCPCSMAVRAEGFSSFSSSKLHSASLAIERRSTAPFIATSSKRIGSSSSMSPKPYLTGSREMASAAMNCGTYSSVCLGRRSSQ